MGQAIGEVIAFGIGVAISPLAIIAVVLMLASPGGRRRSSAFVGAWALGLAVVATLVLLAADGADADGDGTPATWVGVVKLLVGAGLLVLASRQWRGRPDGDAEPVLPAWMSRLDAIPPGRAAGLAVLLASVKPKNLLLTVGAALAVAQAGAASGGQAVALAVFVALGTLGPGAPLALDVLLGDGGAEVLGRLRGWMVRENPTIIAVLCAILAAKLVGDAISTLTA